MCLPPTDSSCRFSSLSSVTRSVVLVPSTTRTLGPRMPPSAVRHHACSSTCWLGGRKKVRGTSNRPPSSTIAPLASSSLATSSSRRDCSRSRTTHAIPIAASVTHTISVRRLYRNQRRRRGRAAVVGWAMFSTPCASRHWMIEQKGKSC